MGKTGKMKPEEISAKACKKILMNSDLVSKHLKVLEEMVRIDSRSFGVNEYNGDRTIPSDMQEILECAKKYLIGIGVKNVFINNLGEKHRFPILIGETLVDKNKPTLLLYHTLPYPILHNHLPGEYIVQTYNAISNGFKLGIIAEYAVVLCISTLLPCLVELIGE